MRRAGLSASAELLVYSRMLSSMDQNVQFYCQRYGTYIQSVLFSEQKRLLLDEDLLYWYDSRAGFDTWWILDFIRV